MVLKKQVIGRYPEKDSNRYPEKESEIGRYPEKDGIEKESDR